MNETYNFVWSNLVNGYRFIIKDMLYLVVSNRASLVWVFYYYIYNKFE